jgi:hypothetical protein
MENSTTKTSRFKLCGVEFLDNNKDYSAPPWTSIRELEHAEPKAGVQHTAGSYRFRAICLPSLCCTYRLSEKLIKTGILYLPDI